MLHILQLEIFTDGTDSSYSESLSGLQKGVQSCRCDKLLQCFGSSVTGHKTVKEEICLLLAFPGFRFSFPSWLFFLCPLFCKCPFSHFSSLPRSTRVFCFLEGKNAASQLSPQCLEQRTHECAVLTSPGKCSLSQGAAGSQHCSMCQPLVCVQGGAVQGLHKPNFRSIFF